MPGLPGSVGRPRNVNTLADLGSVGRPRYVNTASDSTYSLAGGSPGLLKAVALYSKHKSDFVRQNPNSGVNTDKLCKVRTHCNLFGFEAQSLKNSGKS